MPLILPMCFAFFVFTYYIDKWVSACHSVFNEMPTHSTRCGDHQVIINLYARTEESDGRILQAVCHNIAVYIAFFPAFVALLLFKHFESNNLTIILFVVVLVFSWGLSLVTTHSAFMKTLSTHWLLLSQCLQGIYIRSKIDSAREQDKKHHYWRDIHIVVQHDKQADLRRVCVGRARGGGVDTTQNTTHTNTHTHMNTLRVVACSDVTVTSWFTSQQHTNTTNSQQHATRQNQHDFFLIFPVALCVSGTEKRFCTSPSLGWSRKACKNGSGPSLIHSRPSR